MMTFDGKVSFNYFSFSFGLFVSEVLEALHDLWSHNGQAGCKNYA